jgi:hypothetical protein
MRWEEERNFYQCIIVMEKAECVVWSYGLLRYQGHGCNEMRWSSQAQIGRNVS